MATGMAMGKVLRRRFRPLQSRRQAFQAPSAASAGLSFDMDDEGPTLEIKKKKPKLKGTTASSRAGGQYRPGFGQLLGAGSSAGVYTADMLQKLRASSSSSSARRTTTVRFQATPSPERMVAPALPDAESIRTRAHSESARGAAKATAVGAAAAVAAVAAKVTKRETATTSFHSTTPTATAMRAAMAMGAAAAVSLRADTYARRTWTRSRRCLRAKTGAGRPLVRHSTVVAASAPAVSVAGGLSRSEWRLLMCRRRTTRKTTRAGPDAAARMAAAAARRVAAAAGGSTEEAIAAHAARLTGGSVEAAEIGRTVEKLQADVGRLQHALSSSRAELDETQRKHRESGESCATLEDDLSRELAGFEFLQRAHAYGEDLLDCLNEKAPLIEMAEAELSAAIEQQGRAERDTFEALEAAERARARCAARQLARPPAAPAASRDEPPPPPSALEVGGDGWRADSSGGG